VRKPKVFISTVILTGMIAISVVLSHQRARSVADTVMAPLLDEWSHSGTKFLPIGYPGREDGPSWWISYEQKECCAGPLAVQVSLFGKVIVTNPTDLRERIRKAYPTSSQQENANKALQTDAFRRG